MSLPRIRIHTSSRLHVKDASAFTETADLRTIMLKSTAAQFSPFPSQLYKRRQKIQEHKPTTTSKEQVYADLSSSIRRRFHQSTMSLKNGKRLSGFDITPAQTDMVQLHFPLRRLSMRSTKPSLHLMPIVRTLSSKAMPCLLLR